MRIKELLRKQFNCYEMYLKAFYRFYNLFSHLNSNIGLLCILVSITSGTFAQNWIDNICSYFLIYYECLHRMASSTHSCTVINQGAAKEIIVIFKALICFTLDRFSTRWSIIAASLAYTALLQNTRRRAFTKDKQ